MENNSTSMNTVVETYFVEETAELIYNDESQKQWNEKVASLGLVGQTKISQGKSPIPFLYMKRGLQNIFETLCPVEVDIDEYDKSPIPLKLLELVDLSIKEKYFTRIVIRYDDQKPDPVIIGGVGYWYEDQYYDSSNKSLNKMEFKSRQEVLDAGGKHPSCYLENCYLIGRWGDVKKSLEELKEEAIKRYKEETITIAQSRILYYQRVIEDVEGKIVDKFN